MIKHFLPLAHLKVLVFLDCFLYSVVICVFSTHYFLICVRKADKLKFCHNLKILLCHSIKFSSVYLN